jgi:hypothetical protein
MANHLQSLGIDDVCLDEFTSECLANALDGMLQSWPAISGRAREAAPRSRDLHNAARFVAGLLEATRG